MLRPQVSIVALVPSWWIAYVRSHNIAAETMEDWDQDQLEKAVAEKHGQEEAAKPRTAIVCSARAVEL